jgi:cytochrome c-type biogenesis protein
VETLFRTLAGAVTGSAPIAFAAALAWGVLSVVLSPCHLASIPLIIAYVGEQGRPSGRRAFGLSVVFASGILITIGAVGALTASLGRMLGDVGPFVYYAVALVFFFLGLHFLEVVPMPWSGSGPRGTPRRGTIGAFLLGLIFGVGVGPCTFAFLAPMLGVTITAASRGWGFGAALLFAYGVGHTSVIVLAGTSSEVVRRSLNWNESSRGARLLRHVCGVLVLLGGAYLVYAAP